MQTPIRKPGKYTHSKSDPHITPDKLAAVKKELERLQQTALPRAEAEVKHLSDTGDFSENAGYQAAKWKLRGLLARETDLENQIKQAVLINPHVSTGVVTIGSRVTVERNGKQFTYTILGSSETDPSKGIISHLSPIGLALMGCKVDDQIALPSKNGATECRIITLS